MREIQDPHRLPVIGPCKSGLIQAQHVRADVRLPEDLCFPSTQVRRIAERPASIWRRWMLRGAMAVRHSLRPMLRRYRQSEASPAGTPDFAARTPRPSPGASARMNGLFALGRSHSQHLIASTSRHLTQPGLLDFRRRQIIRQTVDQTVTLVTRASVTVDCLNDRLPENRARYATGISQSRECSQ